MPQNASQEVIASQEGDTPDPSPTTIPQATPPSDGQAQEDPDQAHLAELRLWFAKAKEQAELSRLAQLKARVDQGEDVSILEDPERPVGAQIAPQTITKVSRGAKLPEPPKPRAFKGQEKAHYEDWVRDCETYHRRAPQDLATEDEKVQFGLGYVSQDLKRNWEAFVREKEVDEIDWTPTWNEMKQFMHNQLGSEYERTQSAFEELKGVTQGGKTPLEFLNYLRPLWTEAGVFDTQTRIRWYVAGLSPSINRHLRFNYPEEAKTLQEAENRAMSAYRRNKAVDDARKKDRPTDAPRGRGGRGRGSRGSQGGRGGQTGAPQPLDAERDSKRPRTDSASSTTGSRGRGRGSRGRGGRGGRGQGQGGSDGRDSAISCYICKDPSHFASECPKRDDQADNSGNGKATQPQTQTQ
jgi:hypothetical protein